VVQILSLTIPVAYEGKRLVSYDKEKHLVSWYEEKLAVSYDYMILMRCDENTQCVFHV